MEFRTLKPAPSLAVLTARQAQIAAGQRPTYFPLPTHSPLPTSGSSAAAFPLTDPRVPDTRDLPAPDWGGAFTTGCELIPQGWMRDACLIAAGIIPGGNGQKPPAGCPAGWVSDAEGVCHQIVPGDDPTPGGITPGEASLGSRGIMSPGAVNITTLVCPTYADGKKGILWMNALSGEVVCLPRGVNGAGFGLIRKNKPRRKPYISAAEKKQLDVSKGLRKKAKDLASLAGFSCETKAAAAARRARGK